MSGNRFALAGALMASTAIGAMTSAERSKGRYMRAPDGHDDEFAAFEAAGEVEVGKPSDAIESNVEEKPAKPAKPSGKGPREKPADKIATDKAAGKDKADAAAADTGEDEGSEEEGDEEEEEEPKPKPKASERIRELNKRLRQEERLRLASDARLDALEKRLQGGNSGSNGADTGTPAPDPSDADKYPLGHLDDRYIEDKLEWLAERKATGQADAVLQRQQENERQHQAQQAQQAHEALLEKVDDLSTRGSEQFDDFQESVVEAGMRGDWRLDQPTFEAAHEAENGAQILYELSQDKKEAKRVAELSPYQQMKFVMDRDAEISTKSKPRTKPGAGDPPQTRTKGANSSSRIDPATDSLNDFEKAWLADEKASS